MKSHNIILGLALAATALVAACGDRIPTIELESDKTAAVKENMINANKVVIQSEATQIDAYLQRRGWKPTPLRCGACYLLDKKGNGGNVQPDDTAVVTYRLEALDGTPIYRHQTDTLVVGRREVTVALDDVLEQLTYGSTAWLIAPSNTAYGVVGDGDRVASRTPIIYHIQEIKKK
jgi:FKBP-type peptidyl-prolyl cis-trans isomerase